MKRTFALIIFFLLTGCLEKKAADPAIKDAEAVGYACRMSLKVPETCMKENGSMSPAAILEGWKSADTEIKEKTISLPMGMGGMMGDSEKKAEPVKDKPAEPAKPEGKEAKPEGKEVKPK